MDTEWLRLSKTEYPDSGDKTAWRKGAEGEIIRILIAYRLLFFQLCLFKGCFDPATTNMVLVPAINPLVTTVLSYFQWILLHIFIKAADTGVGILQTEFSTAEAYAFLEIYHYGNSLLIGYVKQRKAIKLRPVLLIVSDSLHIHK